MSAAERAALEKIAAEHVAAQNAATAARRRQEKADLVVLDGQVAAKRQLALRARQNDIKVGALFSEFLALFNKPVTRRIMSKPHVTLKDGPI